MQQPLTPLREDQFLTFEMAIDQYKLSRADLEQAIQNQHVRTAYLGDTLILSQSDVAALAGQVRIDRSQFSRYESEGISPAEASRKYGFSLSTLRRWVEHGHVRKMPGKPTGRARYLICRADLEYARRLADVKGLQQGKALFGSS